MILQSVIKDSEGATMTVECIVHPVSPMQIGISTGSPLPPLPPLPHLPPEGSSWLLEVCMRGYLL